MKLKAMGRSIAGLTLVAGLMVASPGWAAGEGAEELDPMSNCVLVAERPVLFGGNASGEFGREGCPSPATVTGQLWHEQPGSIPDNLQNEETYSMQNSRATVRSSCLDGNAQYYTRTVSSGGGTAESGRTAPCP